MNKLPNECLFEVLNNLETGPLFSCLLVNRLWCRIVIPILWATADDHLHDAKLIRICLLLLNAEEKQILAPFEITLPNDRTPLFEYAAYITYITDNLNIGVTYWLGTVNNSTAGSRDAIRCSLIAMFLRTSKDLKYLKVNGAVIQGQTMQDLCNNKTIITLELCNNSFNYEELKEIIVKNSSLISLTLHKSANPQDLASSISDALCKNTTITTLDLSENYLGSIGGEAMTKILRENSTIFSLDLGNNDIGSRGVIAIAGTLHENHTLSSLILNGNSVGDEGGKALAKVLKIDGNNIGAEAESYLQKFLV
ncbi:RNI-like protein [Gigaspora margarita]|uniref:RNI-like protein n=1 Tax=Gigaspora margarita TaxID=4874 RepID=A0A8H3ZYM6_GIGMA|nr:RNI-like protein [Gigaspora margarita]